MLLIAVDAKVSYFHISLSERENSAVNTHWVEHPRPDSKNSSTVLAE